MNKDEHDIDDLFRNALEGHEETPSASLKKKLEASLDKKDAESYKKKFIIWKRTALLLFLFLTGIILFDSGLLQTGKGHTIQKTNSEKSILPLNTTKNNSVTHQQEATSSEINNTAKTKIYQQEIILHNKSGNLSDKENIVDVNPTNSRNKKNILVKPLFPQSHSFNPLAEKLNKNKKEEIVSGITKPGNNNSISESFINELPKWILNPDIIVDKIETQIPIAFLLQRRMLVLNDSVLKNNFTQNSRQKNINKFRPFWSMNGFLSYHQASYKLDSDEPEAITNIKFGEAHEPSFSGELLFTRQFSPRIGLQTGLNYTHTAIGMKPQKTYAFQDPTGDVAYKYITSSGYAFIKPGFGPQPVIGDSLTTAEAKHIVENISIPLVAKYTLLNKKISLIPGIGVEANFITKANLEVDIEDLFNREIVVVRKLNGTKSFYWSFVADVEIRYNLNKKMALTIRPAYRHALSPITKNNIVETFPRGFGIGAGINIKF